MDDGTLTRDNTSDRETGIEQASRVLARGLVISGGVFWMIASFAGPYVYQGTSLADSLRTAIWPLLAAAVILIIGWTYERLAAELLFGAAAAVLVWGVLYAWEVGVWILMTGLVLVPMIISGVLFLVATHTEAKREEATWVLESERRNALPNKSLELPHGATAHSRSR